MQTAVSILSCPKLPYFPDYEAAFCFPRHGCHGGFGATDTTVTKPPIGEAFADKQPSHKLRQLVEGLYFHFNTNTAYMSAGADYADSSDWKF